MSNNFIKLFYAILTMLLALLLESFTLLWGGLLAPSWVIVFLLFWFSDRDGLFGLLAVWIFGVITDVWTGAPLGQNALLFVFIGFFINSAYNDFRALGIFNQSLIIMLIVLVYKLLSDALSFGPAILLSSSSILYLGSAVSSAILWSIMSGVLLRKETR